MTSIEQRVGREKAVVAKNGEERPLFATNNPFPTCLVLQGASFGNVRVSLMQASKQETL